MPDPITDAIRATLPRFDLTDADLIRRAVQSAGRDGPRVPRWAAVRRVFSLGSTSATHLCLAVGVDPEEMVGIDPDMEDCDA